MGVANVVLRCAQIVVDIVVLGLLAYGTYVATHQTYQSCNYDYLEEAVICTNYNIGGAVPPIQIFLLFNAVWTLLVVAFLLFVPMCTSMVHPIAVAVLDGITMLFWFSGSIALAVFIGEYARIVGTDISVAIPAATAGLGFILWILFLVSLILNIRVAMAGRQNNSYGTSANQSYTGPTNFPQQGGYNPQSPGVAAAQGTYMQPSPMQQQQPMMQQPSPMASPMQTPAQQPVQPVQYQQPPYAQQQPNAAYNQGGANGDYYNQNPELAAHP